MAREPGQPILLGCPQLRASVGSGQEGVEPAPVLLALLDHEQAWLEAGQWFQGKVGNWSTAGSVTVWPGGGDA